MSRLAWMQTIRRGLLTPPPLAEARTADSAANVNAAEGTLTLPERSSDKISGMFQLDGVDVSFHGQRTGLDKVVAREEFNGLAMDVVGNLASMEATMTATARRSP